MMSWQIINRQRIEWIEKRWFCAHKEGKDVFFFQRNRQSSSFTEMEKFHFFSPNSDKGDSFSPLKDIFFVVVDWFGLFRRGKNMEFYLTLSKWINLDYIFQKKEKALFELLSDSSDQPFESDKILVSNRNIYLYTNMVISIHLPIYIRNNQVVT